MTTLRSVFDYLSEALSDIGDQCLVSNDAAATASTGEAPTDGATCPQILDTLSSTRYGCHILRLGDQDDSATRTRIWSGNSSTPPFSICPDTPQTTETTSDPSTSDAAAVAPEHVKQLQEDLRALGFLLVGTPDGDFGRKTEQAVREFQIYAGMEYVARIKSTAAASLQVGAHEAAQLGPTADGTLSQYIDSLEQVCNNARYTGPISGWTNQDTRRCIQHWRDNNWRCPVIIEAWNMASGARSTLYQISATSQWAVNVWDTNEIGSNDPRAFYKDFTNYYTYPSTRNPHDMHTLGQYGSYLTWEGPVSMPPWHCWTEAEILPGALTGNAAPTGNTLSTFKIVRASSEVECIGYFDSVNSYDNAVASIGPCHWTFALLNAGNNTVGEGEMGAVISYFEHSQNADFLTAVQRFGVKASTDWTNNAGTANGDSLWKSGQRKFSSYFSRQDDTGAYAQIPSDKRDYVYYQTWHWFFRWVMAGRTSTGYRRTMWDMARVRLRDLRATPWGEPIHGHNNLTVGDVFTSEKAIAMLLRAHIRFPANVCNTNAGTYFRGSTTSAGVVRQGALELAQNETVAQAGTGNIAGSTLTWTGNPSTWTNDHEAALIRGITRTLEEHHPTPSSGDIPGIRTTVQTVHNWPNWSLTGSNRRQFTLAGTFTAGGLSTSRDSFNFDTTGLPPAA